MSLPFGSFFRMIAVSPQGTTTYFSPRFSISGMTGTFPPQVIAGATAVTGTDGPATIDNEGAAPGAPDANGAQFDVPFQSQKGNMRWAPMQSVPPTKITKKNPTPLYPTSAVQIATKHLPIPSITLTVTQSQTFSVQSRENTVSFPALCVDSTPFCYRF
jgi:hypothetical protein